MGSLFGYTGWPGNGGYGASKAAVINLAESLALELHKTGVDVTLVSPGFVNTQLNASYEGKKHFVMSPERCAKRILKKLPNRPYEIAFPLQVELFLKMVRAAPNGLGRAMIRAFIKAMG
jgi:short-subunit dehydrogenase